MYIQGSLIERDGRIFYGDIDVSHIRGCVYFIFPLDIGIDSPILYYIKDDCIKHTYLGPASTYYLNPISGVSQTDEVEDLVMLSYTTAIVFYRDFCRIYYSFRWFTVLLHVPVEHRILDRFNYSMLYASDSAVITYYADRENITIRSDGSFAANPKITEIKIIDTSTFEARGYGIKRYPHLTDPSVTVYDGIYYNGNGDIFTVQMDRDPPYIKMLEEGESIYRKHLVASRFSKTKSARNI